MKLTGHWWTIAPRLGSLSGLRAPRFAGAAWSTTLDDRDRGTVRLSGVFHDAPSGAPLLVIVHGLGGSAESPYAVRTAAVGAARGLAVLRLNLRGADLAGEDIYHGGLTADLAAAFASPEVAARSTVLLLGYSLGGHLALRFAIESESGALAATAAVCSPLDLDRSAAAIDAPGYGLYRSYLLRRLRRILAAAAARNPALPAPEALRSVRTLRAWDGAVVAPRFGFASAEDYYARASVAPLLPRLRRPALLLLADDDPMVRRESVLPALATTPPNLEVRWVSPGGHVGFPRALDLGLPGARGLEHQLVSWLLRSAPPAQG
jgi:predicted alpha/beta-fold hydrolase